MRYLQAALRVDFVERDDRAAALREAEIVVLGKDVDDLISDITERVDAMESDIDVRMEVMRQVRSILLQRR